MFSRRHPFLFFSLIFTGIVSLTIVVLALLVSIGLKDITGFGERRASGKETVGIVEITGVISDSRQPIRHLKQFRKDKSIKAIVLRIDSPGGSVGPSQEIYREVIKTRKKKKIVASMGALAASGGYYVAAAADKIMANPGTITGSIGVIMGYTNVEKLLEKIGLVPVVVKSGRFKDVGSPVKTMGSEEKLILQQVTDGIHHQFIRDIADGREMAIEKVRQVADGRIFTGEAAVQIGLVDRLGNLEDAVQWAGQLTGAKGEVQAVYPRETDFSFLKYLTETTLKILTESALNNKPYVGYLYRPTE